MKSYTDIEQSKKLAEIPPIGGSADMYYCKEGGLPHLIPFYETDFFTLQDTDLPCWSLAALLNVLPNYQLQTQDDGTGILCSCNGKFHIVTTNNPVDACYEMILKLHNLKAL